jgi:hypothetical protein
VHQRSAVHSERGNEAAPHEIDEQRSQANLDDVPADAPQDGSTLLARLLDRREEVAQILRGKNVRKRIQEFAE